MFIKSSLTLFVHKITFFFWFNLFIQRSGLIPCPKSSVSCFEFHCLIKTLSTLSKSSSPVYSSIHAKKSSPVKLQPVRHSVVKKYSEFPKIPLFLSGDPILALHVLRFSQNKSRGKKFLIQATPKLSSQSLAPIAPTFCQFRLIITGKLFFSKSKV